MSNLQALANLRQATANGDGAGAEEAVEEEVKVMKRAVVFDTSHLSQHRYYKGYMLGLEGYDREVLEKFFRKGDASGKVSWGLVKPRGKKSLFADLPGMTIAWKFKGGDDYEAMIVKIKAELTKMKEAEWSVENRGPVALSTFFGDESIARDIWAKIPDQPDDKYYFGGEEGKQVLTDECIGRHMEALRQEVQDVPTFTPEKKREM
jgi:hypothetical protein